MAVKILDYQKLYDSIIEIISPIEKELIELEDERWIALEILYDYGLLDLYIKKWRKSYLIKHILIVKESVGEWR